MLLTLSSLAVCQSRPQSLEELIRAEDEAALPEIEGTLVIAVLPMGAASPEYASLAQEADRLIDEAAVFAMREDSNLRVILPPEVKKAVPGITDSADYDFADYVRIRKATGADIILIGLASRRAADRPSVVARKISANCGRILNRAKSPASVVYEFSGKSNVRRVARFLLAHSKSTESGACHRCCQNCGKTSCIADEMSERMIEAWDDAAQSTSYRAGFSYAKPDESGNLIAQEQGPMPYFLHTPPEYEKTGWGYPLLIYLHGTSAHNETLSGKMIGESPLAAIVSFTDGRPWFDPGRLKLLNQYVKSSFVLMPQVSDSRIDNVRDGEVVLLEDLNRLVAEVLANYPIDLERVYLTGISQGGFRTWSYSELMLDKFAAIAPVCGGDPFASTSCMRTTAVWAHHSYDDKRVGIRQLDNIEQLLPGGMGYGDVNILEDYPFASRKRFTLADACKQNQLCQLYDPLGENQPAPGDFTATFSPVRTGWKPGVAYPEGKINFTMYNRSGHCPWPYANPDFWRWLYDQRRVRVK
jgi:predicted peptidase